MKNVIDGITKVIIGTTVIVASVVGTCFLIDKIEDGMNLSKIKRKGVRLSDGNYWIPEEEGSDDMRYGTLYDKKGRMIFRAKKVGSFK